MYVPRFVKSAVGPIYREFKNDVAFRRSFEGFPPPLDRTMRRVSRTRFSCSDEHSNIPGWLMPTNAARFMHSLAGRRVLSSKLDHGLGYPRRRSRAASRIPAPIKLSIPSISIQRLNGFDHAQMARSASIFQISQNRLASAPRTCSKSR